MKLQNIKKIAWEERKKSLIALLVLLMFFVIPGVAIIAALMRVVHSKAGAYQDLEPSEAYLVAIRLSGGVLLLVPAVIWVLVISRRPY